MQPGCAGGKYEPTTSPRRAEAPPRYNTGRLNRDDGPEDSSLAVRCLTSGLPEFGGATGSFAGSCRPGRHLDVLRRGQARLQRNIVMDGSPHLPASIRQWFATRAAMGGQHLVIDVTNFSLRLIIRARARICTWSSLDAHRPNPRYDVTIEDPTVWTRPWTVKQEFSRQSDEENRLYPEPALPRGHYGLPGLLKDGAWKISLCEDGSRSRQVDARGPLSMLRFHRTRCSNIFACGSLPARSEISRACSAVVVFRVTGAKLVAAL